MNGTSRSLLRVTVLLVLALVALQLYFLARVALMIVIDPQSTTFQRSEAWRLLRTEGRIAWRPQWVDMPQIARHLQRAVIASEDAGFSDHSGVEWDAIEKAWERNQRAQDRVEKINEQREKQAAKVAAKKPDAPAATPKPVIAAANAAINAALKEKSVIDSLAIVGLMPHGSTPEEQARWQKAEYDTWGPLIKKIGFTADS